MPAFGKDGIVNLNQPQEKPVWEVIDSSGKVLAVCDSQNNAESQKVLLTQQTNQELTVRSR